MEDKHAKDLFGEFALCVRYYEEWRLCVCVWRGGRSFS